MTRLPCRRPHQWQGGPPRWPLRRGQDRLLVLVAAAFVFRPESCLASEAEERTEARDNDGLSPVGQLLPSELALLPGVHDEGDVVDQHDVSKRGFYLFPFFDNVNTNAGVETAQRRQKKMSMMRLRRDDPSFEVAALAGGDNLDGVDGSGGRGYKRMSMMRLRRKKSWPPASSSSLMRLKRPSLMRLKRMSMLRLKKAMTKFRLKRQRDGQDESVTMDVDADADMGSDDCVWIKGFCYPLPSSEPTSFDPKPASRRRSWRPRRMSASASASRSSPLGGASYQV